MRLGYNTNGMSHHDLRSAIRVLAEIGYTSVAITLDHLALNPFQTNLRQEIKAIRCLLEECAMRSVIETGTRFLLDPWRKHEPTFLSPDPSRRLDFYRRAIDIAGELESDCVSLWSGVLRDSIAPDVALERLAEGLGAVLDYADQAGVVIGFEPEPGMLIDSMPKLKELMAKVPSSNLRLTLDLGHLHCQGETPIPDVIHQWKDQLVNVHIEDMRAGVHEHLPFGEGEMDFPPILAALQASQYRGGLHVELSRHSHMGPQAAQAAFDYLSVFLNS